ncbi:peptidoglycan glycosyltransferase [Polymorphobacter glacialis]|uniref:Peptidoglycan glycosyltransferase n=1 Tax=Sandarakinorhabdus glacialis TaxID=1614636 RepID=A0A916ZYV1_9SPHN|nr:penicillin-binding protein 2 [Polymorphobacter glacialis]GGE19433.1 peptidoglycan glycosyltransferase [Polymorphobacter glacialis]
MSNEAIRQQGFTRRALFLGGGMGLVGAALATRMAWLSIFEGEKYRLASEDNRVQLRLIPPRRGWIVDRNGKPLALNKPDYRLELIPDQIGDLDAVLKTLGGILALSYDDELRIRADIAIQPGYMPVEVKRDLDWPTFAGLNVKVADVLGLRPVQAFSRVYPDADHFAHLLGYVGSPTPNQYKEQKDPLLIFPGFRIGKDGIERHEDRLLRGKAGARREEVTARGKVVRELDTRGDEPGATLKLTIDRDLQSFTARRLGDNSASVIVIDCVTGDVLTMVSMPAYDPNVFSTRVPTKLWKELQDNDHNPLLNKSAMGLYPPGSTFKMVTSLAVLAAGVPPGAGTSCSGKYRLGNNTWHCHSRRGHGFVNMHTALPKSCDVYFYAFGRQVGIDAIAVMARRMGLGQKYELPLPGQAAGIVPDIAWKDKRYGKPWNPGETLNTSIGQGYLIANPLQLAVMTARVASGREVMPRLLVPTDGSPPPEFPSLGIPEEHLQIVRQGMYDVINSGIGTARGARSPIDGVHFAGKTGTAQVRRITAAERRAGVKRNEALPWKQRDHALFVAFAPTEEPRYAISVIIEHGIAGGRYAGPIARDVLTFLYDPERAMKTLIPIEAAMKARREAEARAAAVEAAAVAEPETLMPSWLRMEEVTPPVFEIAPPDAPQPERDEP